MIHSLLWGKEGTLEHRLSLAQVREIELKHLYENTQTRTPALKSSAMLRSTVLGCGEVSGRDRRQDSGKLPFLGPEHRGLPEQLWLPSRPTWAGDDGGVRAERVLERSVKGLWHLCLPSHMVLALSLSRQSCCHRAGWGGRAPGPPRGARGAAVTGTSALL